MNKLKGLMGPLPHTTIDQAMETAHRMSEYYTRKNGSTEEIMLYVIRGDNPALPFMSVLGVADNETRKGIEDNDEVIAFCDIRTSSAWHHLGDQAEMADSAYALEALIDAYEAERNSSPEYYISPVDNLLQHVTTRELWDLFMSRKVKV